MPALLASEAGADTGDIRDLVVDPSSPSTVYAAAFFLRVLKTTDGGAIWNPADGGFEESARVEAVEIDPSTPSTLYALTSSHGIYKTTDGAASWNPANQGLPFPFMDALAVDPAVSTTLYASDGSVVYKSTDAGGVSEFGDVAGSAWSPTGDSGFKDIDETGTASGTRRVVLRAGEVAKSRMTMLAEGDSLPDPTLGSLTLPVTAQLLNDETGLCLQSVFGAPDVQENDERLFKGLAR